MAVEKFNPNVDDPKTRRALQRVAKAITELEALTGGGAGVSDAAYGAGWNGVTTIAPSKNAVYDKIETLVGYPGVGIALSTGSAWGTSIADASANWNTAYGWGNHATAGYAPLVSPSFTTPALGAATGASLQLSGLTASQILGTDASKNLVSLAVATYPSLAELAYVKGVTSAIQPQLDAKGVGTVTSVSGTAPIAVATGTTTPVVKLNDAGVTLAKIQNAAASSKLLGSGATGIGASYVELTLGTNLSMSGTTLNATGGGTPGGATTQVQYNDGGAFAGDASFIYNKTTHDLSLAGLVVGSALQSSVVTGSIPVIVASTTLCGNLNADMVDGKHVGTSGNTVALLDGANTWSGVQTLTTPLLGTPTSGILTNCTGLPTAGLVDGAVTGAKLAANTRIAQVTGMFDGGGSAIASGKTIYIPCAFAGTIAAWTILVDTGTCTIEVWKKATGTAIPTVADKISASAPMAISSGTAIRSTTMTGWTTAVAANDIFGFSITAISGATQITVALEVTKT